MTALLPSRRPSRHQESQPKQSARAVHTMASAAPIGDWESPITTEQITSKSIRLGAAKAGPDGLVYWLEGRPTEGGRYVLVRRYSVKK